MIKGLAEGEMLIIKSVERMVESHVPLNFYKPFYIALNMKIILSTSEKLAPLIKVLDHDFDIKIYSFIIFK